MIKRTDIHRPSAINPEEYEYVGSEFLKIESLGDCYFIEEERKHIKAHMARTGGTYSRHKHGGNCMVCGSVNAIYTILFYHRPSNTYVRMGSDCAEKCEMANFSGQFDAFHTACRNALDLAAGKRKAQAVLEESGLQAAWELYTAANVPDKFEENTIRDIVGKLVKYGSISEAQEGFVRNLLVKIPQRAAKQAQFEAEKAAALPVPEGRITIEGIVLKMEDKATDFGIVTKIVVKSAGGWVVWGSAPTNINFTKGATIRFDAKVERSSNDEKFGFYKRPTKAVVVQHAAGVQQ